VREFVSSTTLVGLTDLPFALIFFLAIGFLAGSLVWVPVAAGVVLLMVGLISQWPIRRSVERYQYENSQKLAFMVEAIERSETIQAIGAQAQVRSRWERICAITARSGNSSKMAAAVAVNISTVRAAGCLHRPDFVGCVPDSGRQAHHRWPDWVQHFGRAVRWAHWPKWLAS